MEALIEGVPTSASITLTRLIFDNHAEEEDGWQEGSEPH